MICANCARAADIARGRVGIAPCPFCERTISLTPKGRVLAWHKYDGLRCLGSKLSPYGHEACRGGTHCDCQHKQKES